MPVADKRKFGEVMIKVAAEKVVGVVVPYYQRDAGILRRAVQSVCDQDLPDDVIVKLVIVDDQSPRPAKQELDGFNFPSNVHLTVIEQSNGGPGVARNTGLDQLGHEVSYVAFLDSDDIWSPPHLRNKLALIDNGADFVFCDNRRAGHHESYLRSCAPNTSSRISNARVGGDEIRLPAEALVECVIEEFPAQLSTVVFRRAIAPELRFDASLRCSGEDVLYLVSLIAKAKVAAFDPDVVVECGEGVNIYFSHFEWNSPMFIKILRDRAFCHSRLDRVSGLPKHSREKNMRVLRRIQLDFAFHSVRLCLKRGGSLPVEVREICSVPQIGWSWWIRSVLYLAWAYPLRKYVP